MGKCATARNKMQYEPERIGEGSCGKEAAAATGKWAHVRLSAYLKNDTSQFFINARRRPDIISVLLFFDTAPRIRK
jgi:hypothetical protein